jgi:hypothetical protein
MHIHSISSIRWASIYRSIGDEEYITEKALAHSATPVHFQENLCNLQVARYAMQFGVGKLLRGHLAGLFGKYF